MINNGTVTVAQAGLAALVAPGVANNGVISAKLGHVVLGGAQTYTLDFYGDGLIQFDVGSPVTTVPVGRNGPPNRKPRIEYRADQRARRRGAADRRHGKQYPYSASSIRPARSA